MKLTVRPLTTAVLLLALCTEASHADSSAIVPGHSLGAVWLGASRATLLKLWGRPATARRTGTYTVAHWATGKDGNYYKNAILRNGRVVQLETDDSGFKTADGISMSSNLGQIRHALGAMRLLSFDEKKAMPEFAAHFYEAKPRGIAFELDLGERADTSAKNTPHAIIIHRRGHRFLRLGSS